LALQVPSSGHLVGCPDSGVPNDRLLGNAHERAPLQEQKQYYEAGFVGGTTLMCNSSSCAWSTGLGAPSIKS
jgi:hypothetical protein